MMASEAAVERREAVKAARRMRRAPSGRDLVDLAGSAPSNADDDLGSSANRHGRAHTNTTMCSGSHTNT